MKILTLILILTSSISTFGQQPDSAETAEYYQKILDQAKNWKQEDEPWDKLLIQLTNPYIKINYLQQAAHPFLAEYNRRLILQSENKKTDSLEMTINPGGRTKINLYKIINTSTGNTLIKLTDNYGDYFIDPNTLEYFEFEEVKGYDREEYLGKIDGQDYPIKFIDKEKGNPFELN